MNGRTFTLSVPFPVPLHACFVKSKGGTGIPSARYKAYRRDFAAAVTAQGAPKARGPVTVEVVLCAPDARVRDYGNLDKALFDNLVHCGVIEDDSNRVVLAGTWAWMPDRPPCTVTVREVAPAMPEPVIPA